MYRKTAVLVGVLFIIGTVSGVLSGLITSSIQDTSDPLTAISLNETQWILGTLLILVMGFVLAMIPVVLYPVFKKHNEVLALGAVLFRGVLEAVCYLAIVISMLMLLSASQMANWMGTFNPTAPQLTMVLLKVAGDWLSLILALVFSIGALMIYTLFYQTRLVPRWLSGWGLIGAVLYFAAPLITMFNPPHTALFLDSWPGFLMAPLALQEMVFAVWLIVKGFSQPTAVTMDQPVLTTTGD